MAEGGPVGGPALPALQQQPVELPGAHRGPGGRAPSSLAPAGSVLDHLLGRQLAEGLLGAEGEQLPEGDAEGPYVAHRRVLALRMKRALVEVVGGSWGGVCV